MMELQIRAREALEQLAPHELPVVTDYYATEDLYAVDTREFYSDEQVEERLRTLLEDLEEYSKVADEYNLDCWTNTFVPNALELLTTEPSAAAARAAVRPFQEFFACGSMASTRDRAAHVGVLSIEREQTVLQVIEAAQLAERLQVFDAVVSHLSEDE